MKGFEEEARAHEEEDINCTNPSSTSRTGGHILEVPMVFRTVFIKRPML